MEAVGEGCGEPEEGGEDEEDASGFVQAPTAVDVEDDAAGEEFKRHRSEEGLDDSGWGEADVEFEQDDCDAPEGDEPAGEPLGNEEEKEEEDEIEVELGGEGPGLEKDEALVGGKEEIGREDGDGVEEVCSSGRLEAVGDEGEGGVDPEDGEDASEAVVEKADGFARLAEFADGNGGDDDAADDEEEVDAERAVFEEERVIGVAEFGFDAVKVDGDDEERGESAADLDADDAAGVSLRWLVQCAAPVAPLYQCGVLRGIHTGGFGVGVT